MTNLDKEAARDEASDSNSTRHAELLLKAVDRIEELERAVIDLRGGPPGPYADCTDCGRAMVWDRTRHETPLARWVCPGCVLDRAERLKAKLIAEVGRHHDAHERAEKAERELAECDQDAIDAYVAEIDRLTKERDELRAENEQLRDLIEMQKRLIASHDRNWRVIGEHLSAHLPEHCLAGVDVDHNSEAVIAAFERLRSFAASMAQGPCWGGTPDCAERIRDPAPGDLCRRCHARAVLGEKCYEETR